MTARCPPTPCPRSRRSRRPTRRGCRPGTSAGPRARRRCPGCRRCLAARLVAVRLRGNVLGDDDVALVVRSELLRTSGQVLSSSGASSVGRPLRTLPSVCSRAGRRHPVGLDARGELDAVPVGDGPRSAGRTGRCSRMSRPGRRTWRRRNPAPARAGRRQTATAHRTNSVEAQPRRGAEPDRSSARAAEPVAVRPGRGRSGGEQVGRAGRRCGRSRAAGPAAGDGATSWSMASSSAARGLPDRRRGWGRALERGRRAAGSAAALAGPGPPPPRGGISPRPAGVAAGSAAGSGGGSSRSGWNCGARVAAGPSPRLGGLHRLGAVGRAPGGRRLGRRRCLTGFGVPEDRPVAQPEEAGLVVGTMPSSRCGRRASAGDSATATSCASERSRRRRWRWRVAEAPGRRTIPRRARC